MLESLYAALPLVVFGVIIFAVMSSLQDKKGRKKKKEETTAKLDEGIKNVIQSVRDMASSRHPDAESTYWDIFDKSVQRAVLDVTNSLNIYNRSPKLVDDGRTFYINEFKQPDVQCELVNVRKEAYTSSLHLMVQIYVDYEVKSQDETQDKRNLFFWKTLNGDIRNIILKETLPEHKIDQVSQPVITTEYQPISDLSVVIGAYIIFDIEFLKQK